MYTPNILSGKQVWNKGVSLWYACDTQLVRVTASKWMLGHDGTVVIPGNAKLELLHGLRAPHIPSQTIVQVVGDHFRHRWRVTHLQLRQLRVHLRQSAALSPSEMKSSSVRTDTEMFYGQWGNGDVDDGRVTVRQRSIETD